MSTSSDTGAQSPTRELAAIMFSDIAGYTRIMGRDEQEALRMLDAHRAMLTALLPKFNGRLIGEIGDGTLSSFHSATDAVNCAREVQALAEQKRDCRLRIGIHLGDVVFSNDTVLGDGVNVASRLHALAPPGGICISEHVYDEIRNKPGGHARNVGTKRLKNVARPIRVYALENDAETVLRLPSLQSWILSIVGAVLAVAAVAYFIRSPHFLTFQRSMTPIAAIRSLAVLPLQNLSGNQADEYFSEGITDELITDLAQIAPLRVTSRTSVMQFKGTTTSLPEIGRKLRVDAVVEGSVVRIGDRVRVTAQLLETATDRHIWANNFEESSTDILRLQDELARAIAQAIRLELSPTQRARLSKRHQVDPEAYDDYLRGRFFWNARTEESLAKAQDYFQKSLAKDPLFAPAYSGLADAYFYRGYFWGHLAPREAMPLARAAALKAIQLDENSAEGRTSLAMVKFFYDWNFRDSEQEFRQAILLNPNYPTAHHFLAINLVALGHYDDAIAEARKAVEADPLSVPVNNILGETLAETGHIDEAITQFRKTLELDPNNPLVLANIRGCYIAKNQPQKAFEENVKWLIAIGVTAKDIEGVRKVYKESGWLGLCKIDLQTSLARWNKDHWHVDAYSIGSDYAFLGQFDRAFDWFNKCLELRSGTMTWLYLGNDPMLLKLRADPRFAEIERTMEAPLN